MNDEVFIEALMLNAIIGIRPAERITPQPLSIDIRMALDCSMAARSGNIEDSVSYSDVARRVEAFVIERKFELLETLAYETAQLLLEDQRLQSATVTARKPEAVSNADAVGVRVHCKR